MIYDSSMQMYNCLTDSQNDLEFKGFIIHKRAIESFPANSSLVFQGDRFMLTESHVQDIFEALRSIFGRSDFRVLEAIA